MKPVVLLALAICALSQQPALACECFPSGPFFRHKFSKIDPEKTVVFVGRVVDITPKSDRELQSLLMAKLPPDVQSKAKSANVDEAFRAEVRVMLARAQTEVYLDLWGDNLTEAQRQAFREHDSGGNPMWLLFEGRRVRFEVEERFIGEPSVTAVDTGYGGGDCAFDFLVGEQYLVVARQLVEGRYRSGLCTGTDRVEDATESLEALREWKARQN